jgi:hypothetical protein
MGSIHPIPADKFVNTGLTFTMRFARNNAYSIVDCNAKIQWFFIKTSHSAYNFAMDRLIMGNTLLAAILSAGLLAGTVTPVIAATSQNQTPNGYFPPKKRAPWSEITI